TALVTAIAAVWVWFISVVRPWSTFLKVLLDPYTALLVIVAAFLGIFGPEAVGKGNGALLQVIIAIVTGVVGARISTAMAAINQEGKLYSSGRMAVRGLRLILQKTIALEKRVASFVHEGSQESAPEVRAAMANRNLDEVLESVRMLQMEVAGSIENWVEVVPDADVSAIFLAVADARDQLSKKEIELQRAIEDKDALEAKGNADTESLKLANGLIAQLKGEKVELEGTIRSLKKVASQNSPGPEITWIRPNGSAREAIEAITKLGADERARSLSTHGLTSGPSYPIPK
ncbi:MAG: hypothetical protein ACN6RG_12030, partial [Stenotrophomonas sp.]